MSKLEMINLEEYIKSGFAAGQLPPKTSKLMPDIDLGDFKISMKHQIAKFIEHFSI